MLYVQIQSFSLNKPHKAEGAIKHISILDFYPYKGNSLFMKFQNPSNYKLQDFEPVYFFPIPQETNKHVG